ncbi:MAG: hydantoinase B/oxoprolinase family protein [Aquisalinus sp.]|nr:hydantoinase B/oxoprolinase family protein [Aquisalinus sp.]
MTHDNLSFQLAWNRLLAIVEEQAQTLIRTAFSTTVREAGDLSAGIFDTSGRMLAQAVTGTPGHVNAMAASVGKFLQKYPLNTLEEGDVLLTNDPWDGTGHLNDFTVVTPAFRHNQCIALFAATSHIADVGGLGFGPDARQVFEEGVLIPIDYLFRRGQLNDSLIGILKANVRDPVAAEGDLYSLSSCNATGAKRLKVMMDELGFETLETVGDQIIETSARAMKAEISELPAGVYANTMRIDGYNSPLDLTVEVTISPDHIKVDFAGSSPVQPFGINVPLTYTQAYASFGVRCVIGGDIPNNYGSLSAIEVSAPEGCVLNAPRPAAVSARHTVGQMLPDVVLGALSNAIPDRTPVEGASCLYLPVLMGGEGVCDGASGQPFIINPFYTGGTGARPEKDGLSCTAFPSGVKNTPVEINEVTAPVIMWRKEYVKDSGGAGQYTGGMGQVLEFSHAGHQPMVISKMFERVQNAARGQSGGMAGGKGSVTLSGGIELKGMGRDIIPEGQRIIIQTPGGGGKGSPQSRSQEATLVDLKSGFISRRNALENFGLSADEIDNKYSSDK